VQVWLSTPDRRQLLARQADLEPAPGDSAGATTIVIDTSQRFQAIAGFGAAITDASAELLQQGLAPTPRAALLQELFGRGDGEAGFTMVRVTIGASDFSRRHDTYDDVPAGTRDDALAHFSIAAARINVLPVLRQARAINPQLTVIATPWSPPAWMKSSQSLIGGTLLPDAYPVYADYLVRYVRAFADAGVPIAYLTVQNEPHNEPKDYPGMRFEAAQRAAFIGQHLGPRLAQRRVGTRILDWDHNWDEPQSPLGVLADTVARAYVAGVAWHCYAGEVSAQSSVHNVHPDADVFFTECAGGDWAPNFGDNLRWNVRTLIIGTMRNWARGITLWNLALDPRHGPHLGGCTDCRGVLTIDPANGTVTRNEEFYALAHASRFVRPGAVRIASTSGVDGVDTVALRNADHGSVVLIATNSTTAARTLRLRTGVNVVRAVLPPGAVATYVWR
jgi:glucosylceramidase